MHYELASGYCIHSISEREANTEALRLTDGTGVMTGFPEEEEKSGVSGTALGIGALILLLLSQVQ